MTNSEFDAHARSFLLIPQERETVYSVCSRYHLVSGSGDPRVTSMLLVGHPRAAAYHDFPIGLDRLASISEGRITPTLDCLRERTVLAAYLPLMSGAERARVLLSRNDSKGGPLSTVRVRLSWQLSRTHELRFCPACLAEDSIERGFSYWRTPHQLPGAWTCLRHREVLRYVPIQTKKLTSWLTVEDASLLSERHMLSKAAFYEAERLTSCIDWIGSRTSLDSAALASMVRLRLRSAGLIRSEMKIHPEEMQRVANAAPAAQGGSGSLDGPGDWVEACLYDKRSSHPVRWAQLLAAAGDINQDKLSADYLEACARLPELDLFDCHLRKRASAPWSFYEALAGPVTVVQAAARLGVPLAELQIWLRRDRELATHWRARATESRRRDAVLAIERFLTANAPANRMDVMRAAPWAVRFLQAHAPEALAGLLPPAKNKSDGQRLLF